MAFCPDMTFTTDRMLYVDQLTNTPRMHRSHPPTPTPTPSPAPTPQKNHFSSTPQWQSSELHAIINDKCVSVSFLATVIVPADSRTWGSQACPWRRYRRVLCSTPCSATTWTVASARNGWAGTSWRTRGARPPGRTARFLATGWTAPEDPLPCRQTMATRRLAERPWPPPRRSPRRAQWTFTWCRGPPFCRRTSPWRRGRSEPTSVNFSCSRSAGLSWWRASFCGFSLRRLRDVTSTVLDRLRHFVVDIHVIRVWKRQTTTEKNCHFNIMERCTGIILMWLGRQHLWCLKY